MPTAIRPEERAGVRRRRHFSNAALAALVAALALPAPSAGAQTPPPLEELSLEQLMEVKVGTVYGAALRVQRTGEAPSSVSIVTSEEIKRFGWRTLAELLGAVRSFYLNDDRVYTYLGVRGLQRPGDYNSRVLVLLDGHPTNENLYGGASFGRDAIVDLALVDRVEVIRGPGSSLYGTGAFFGVVNLITRSGADVAATELAGAAGSLATREGRASFGRRFAGGADLVVSGSAFASDGEAEFHLAAFDDPAGGEAIAHDADDEQAGSLFLRLSRGGLTLEGAWVDRDRTSPSAPYGTIFDTDRTWSEDVRGFLDLHYRGALADGVELSARASYDTYRYRANYFYDYAAEGEEPLPTDNRDEGDGDWLRGETHAVVTAAAGHTLTAGVAVERHFARDQRNFDLEPYTVYLDDARDSWNWGVFGQDEVRLGERVALTVGARYDHYETFGGTLNPRVALVWSPRETTDVKLLYGRAFRAPNAYELYYTSSELYKQNPDIDPERIATYEAVIEQRVGEAWRVTAGAFHYRISDVVDLVEDPADGTFLYDNAGTVTASGAEVEVAGKWPGGLQTTASYSYQEVREDETDEIVANSPRHLAKARVLAPVLPGRLLLGAEGRYQSSRRTVTEGKVDGYAVVDATLSTAPGLLGPAELTLTVRNLLDASADDPTADDFAADRVPRVGRTFTAGVTVRF